MKVIKMGIQKFSRPGVILMATVVVIITSMVIANATQTITTSNAAYITYNLAPGASSAPITPATSKSVLVMGCCTSGGDQSVGQVSLFHIPSGGMVWVGLQSYPATAIASGTSSTQGHVIVSIDSNFVVYIEVNSADTIRVHNASAGTTLAGNVTLIW